MTQQSPPDESSIQLAEDTLAAGFGALAGLLEPGLAVPGAMAAPVVVRIARLSLDAVHRKLSGSERQRLLTVVHYAATELTRRWETGERLRQDIITPTVWASAGQLVEGTLLTAQRQYQERKNQHLGHFLTQILFDEQINLDDAFLYLSIADRLTYQQYLLLTLFDRRSGPEPLPLSTVRFNDREGDEIASVLLALNDCLQMGLLAEGVNAYPDSPAGPLGGLTATFGGESLYKTAPWQLSLSRVGSDLARVLGLEAIPTAVLQPLVDVLGHPSGRVGPIAAPEERNSEPETDTGT